MEEVRGRVVIGGVVASFVSRFILEGFAARRRREVEVFILLRTRFSSLTRVWVW